MNAADFEAARRRIPEVAHKSGCTLLLAATLATVTAGIFCATAHADDDDDDDDDDDRGSSSSRGPSTPAEMWPPISIDWPPLIADDSRSPLPIVIVGPPPGLLPRGELPLDDAVEIPVPIVAAEPPPP